MRTRIHPVGVLLTLALPGLVAAQAPNEIGVVQRLERAVDSENVDQAVSLFAKGAKLTLPDGTVLQGREAVKLWLEDLAEADVRVELSDFQVTGHTVAFTSKVQNDDWKRIGVNEADVRAVADVRSGAIHELRIDQTPETREALGQALSAANKKVARSVYTEIMNTGRVARADRYLSPDFVAQDLPPDQQGIEGFRTMVKDLRSAFPDLTFEVEEVVPTQDWVMVTGTVTATHRGEYLGVEPTGKRVEVPFIDGLRIVDGKVVEHVGGVDAWALRRQLTEAQPVSLR